MNLEAFEKGIIPVKNKLFRFALRFLGNEEEAKDIVQEVFIKVWNGRGQMDQVRNHEAWCMQITRNLSLDRLRAQSRNQTQSIEMTFDVQHHAPGPHETAETGDSMQNVSELIAALPAKQRQVIHLRDVEGYSYQEISEILELDMSQVKVNLFRARNTVRERLKKMDAYGL